MRDKVLALLSAGFSQSETAKLMGISHQRVEQIKNPDKHAARAIVALLLERGELVRQPCEVCAEENVHAHHPDYTEPERVTWLCPQHHADEHRRINGTYYEDNPEPIASLTKQLYLMCHNCTSYFPYEGGKRSTVCSNKCKISLWRKRNK